MKSESLVGNRYARYVVVKALSTRLVECLCDCGKTKKVYYHDLLSGKVKSCGCFGIEQRRKSVWKHGLTSVLHQPNGRHPLFATWHNMLRRCMDPRTPSYKTYGARGVTVCNRWLDFAAFVEDMGEKPKGNYSLDRIDGTKGYSPDNCRWATDAQQCHNSKVTKLTDADVLAIRADTRPYKEIAAQYGISPGHVTKVRSGKFYPRLKL